MKPLFTYRSIAAVGVWIIVLPFLGFPQSWKTFFLFVTGVALIYDSYARYRLAHDAVSTDHVTTPTYVEHTQTEHMPEQEHLVVSSDAQ